ncbi:Uncharacterized protein Adt_48770 [Abeliophyllum distichum]|uniref:Uncharacterized protein n=1 Tax=Abeliophyllum distichum TaxID=126358 RepID=A0ABD1NQP4_9LAMI
MSSFLINLQQQQQQMQNSCCPTTRNRSLQKRRRIGLDMLRPPCILKTLSTAQVKQCQPPSPNLEKHRKTFIIRVERNAKPSIFPTHKHGYESMLKSLSTIAIDAKLSDSTDESNLGSDLVIEVIHTRIWPERKSFNDRELGPVPTKWKGQCVAPWVTTVGTGNIDPANLHSWKLASFGKRFVRQIVPRDSTLLPITFLFFRRGVHVSVYDKNPEEHVRPTVVPDDVIAPQSDKYWAP